MEPLITGGESMGITDTHRHRAKRALFNALTGACAQWEGAAFAAWEDEINRSIGEAHQREDVKCVQRAYDAYNSIADTLHGGIRARRIQREHNRFN